MKKYKLPKEFLDRWVEALRSNNYIGCTPQVIANIIMKETGKKDIQDTLKQIHWAVLRAWISQGGGKAAQWLTENVEPI